MFLSTLEDTMATFVEELREKLPPDEISVSAEEGLVSYYDWHGITFRESAEEQAIIEAYLLEVIATKVGYPVKVTWWGDSNNGHFTHRFEQAE